MLIPNFDHNNVLPPYKGNPTQPADLSPYESNTLELCQRFATSKERKNLLLNLLNFREKMNTFGIINGFQWIGGSFSENIEASENRNPKDIDLITFHRGIPNNYQEIVGKHPELFYSESSKAAYNLDHYFVDIAYKPDVTVHWIKYWIQLFTHNRRGVWKGMIRIELNTPNIDQQARDYLNNI